MSAAPTCGKCRSQRWMSYVRRLSREELESGEWKPFDRAGWNAYGELLISLALTLKALKPCEDCNAKGLPPWHETFRKREDAAPEFNVGGIGEGGTAFDAGQSLRGATS